MRYVPLFGCVYESYKHRKRYLAKGIHQMFHPLSLSFVAWVLSGVAATDPDLDEKVNGIGRRVGRGGAET